MTDVATLADVEAPPPPPALREAPSRSLTRTIALAGAVMLGVLFLAAVFAPVLARHPPEVASGRPFESPSAAHPLGTNDVGQDLWAQLLHGARISLAIGVLSAAFAIAVGLAVALVAGWYRGKVENVLMRLVDLTLAFPFFVLVIVLAAFFGRGLMTTVLVIGAVIWARPARVLRSQVIKLRELGHVTAARAMGASGRRIIARHILPRTVPLAAAQFVRAANVSVLIEASLSFLGLGDTNRISWGTTLYFANSRSAILTSAWKWWILPPGLALTVAICGFAFLGYAVEEWADPRLSRLAVRRMRGGRRRAPVRPPSPRPVPDADGGGPAGAARDRPGGADRGRPGGADRGGPVLSVEGLVIEYRTPAGRLRAVDGVDLEVGSGRVVGLVGESGSGKSTLAMALLGLIRRPGRVVQGRVVLDGRDLRQLTRARLAALRGRELALVPQSAMNSLNPAYTVVRQVAEAAGLTRPPREAANRAREVLELVGIPAARHRAYPHELSGGMRQRVVIAMAVVNEPALLVADEPVTGLDVVTQARILRLLLELRERLGLALLLISHDLPLVARVSDDLVVMYGGRVVERGPAAAVKGEPGHPYTRQLLGAFPSLRGPRVPLVAIKGDPPDLLRPPTGCRFHPRCPLAFDACRVEDPALFEPVPGHPAACLLRQ